MGPPNLLRTSLENRARLAQHEAELSARLTFVQEHRELDDA
jgi:hypothetical protein